MTDNNVSTEADKAEAKKPLGKMTKDELVAEATRLEALIGSMQDELTALKGGPVEGRKLDMEKAERIRAAAAAGESKNALARRYMVSRDTIRAVIAGQIYKPIDPEEVARKAAEKEAAEKAKEERKAQREKERQEALDKKAQAAEARKAEREKKAADKAAKAAAEADGTGPVKGAKKGPKSKTVGAAPVDDGKTPEERAEEAAAMRRAAFERAQQRVAAKRAAEADNETGATSDGEPQPEAGSAAPEGVEE